MRKDKEIRETLGVLSTYQAALVLHLSRRNAENTTQIHRLISLLEDKIPSGQLTALSLPADTGSSASTVEDTSIAITRPRAHYQRHKRNTSSKCILGLCQCQCHAPMRGFSGPCMMTSLLQNVFCGCEHREYFMAIHLFRKFCVLKLSLNWQDHISVNCALTYYGTVNHTSPGFMILYKCQEGLMGMSEALSELEILRENGDINFKEVDPSGKGWIQASLITLIVGEAF